jgi:Flp pilus assembly pilin Flp
LAFRPRELRAVIRRFWHAREERGAVSAEYAILLVFVALAVIVGMIALAIAITNFFYTGANTF